MRRAWTLVYAMLTAGLLFWRLRNWAYDDVFITYRYAANLASGAGMVYQAGERVLSTTSLLWAALLAPFAALGWDVHAAAVLLGALSLAGGGYCLWLLGQAARQPWIGWAGLLLYPLHPLVVGTLGSETPLYLALGLGALALHAQKRDELAAGCAGLAAVARPDGLLFAALIGLDGLAQAWTARRRGQAFLFPWRAGGVFLLTWLPWVVWAWIYYGSPLPVTLAAKQQQAKLAASASFWEGTWQTLHTLWGAIYFRGELILAGLGFLYLAWRVAKAWRSAEARRELAEMHAVGLLLGWTGAYFAVYVALGVTRYFWYYAPLLPALVVGMGLGLAALESLAQAGLARGEQPGWRTLARLALQETPRLPAVLAGLVCLGLVAGQLVGLAQTAEEARVRVYTQVGEWLAVHTDPAVSVGALEVGIIGYTSQRKMVDFAGLLQPATAAQLSQQGSYDRTAVWAVQAYKPEILVLQDGLFPELENRVVGKSCAESARFPGLKWDMVVYTCKW